MASRKTASRATGARRRSYVQVATAYAKEAAGGAPWAGKWLQLAAKRFLRDLERASLKRPPFIFSEWHATDACDFLEKLPHVEGTWDTPTIVLDVSDVFFVVNLFGFRNHDGNRRFTQALKAVARKNAKSTIAAGIGLYCQNCEGEVGPQVISAATTGQQARIVWGIAQRMVQRTADLREAFQLEAFANAIASYSNGGTFKPINAKASTQDGLNPSVAVIDEVHAHKTHDLLNVLKSAAGARANPLFLFTTTEGYESPGPWPELRHFSKQVLEGVIEADHFLVLYYAIDDEDDDFDESAWVKANPLMVSNPMLLREMRKSATEARAMPGQLAEFRIKRLNRPASAPGNWVDYPIWAACRGPIDLEALRGRKCWGGLDLANTTDLACFRLVWELDDGTIVTWGRKWVPARAVSQRTERGTIPYAGWVAAGYLEQTDGEVTDYRVIRAAVNEARERFNIQNIAYDPWNAAQLIADLEEDGAPMELFIQGPKSYHPAMQAFDLAYRDGKFRHGDDPVLTWNASNLVARRDDNLNMAPDRRRSLEKIDDMVALLMAVGVMRRAPVADAPTIKNWLASLS